MDLTMVEVQVDMPNIFGRRKADEPEKPMKIYHEIKPFVMALAQKYPQWKFVSFRYLRYHDHTALSAFRVMENREVIGEIGSDTRGGKVVYTLYNDRIKARRVRGRETRTSDLKKAVRLAGLMFGAKTIAELIEAAFASAHDVIHSRATEHDHGFNAMYRGISAALQPYILQNMETLGPIAVKNGANAEAVQKLTEQHEQKMISREAVKQFDKGFTVIIRGDDYAVMEKIKGDPQTKIYATDSLPAHIKKCVGMLKLVEKQTVIDGIGARVGEAAFFVLPEVPNE